MLKCRVCCGLLLLLRIMYVSCETEQCSENGSDGWNSQLMVQNIGSRNATLRWSQDASRSNATYIVLYRDVIGISIRSEPISGQEQTFTYNIVNLTPETNYSVQVCQTEINSCGNCVVTFITLPAEEPSGPPTDVIILASGPSTLTVSWSPPLINPEVVLEYFIRCAQQSDPSNSQTTSRRNFVTSAPFHNLIPNTAYKCEVHTTSTFGNSTSARASATTPPRETAPGLFFIVTQGQIRYKQLTESTLSDEFFSLLESPYMFLLDVGDGTNILGVDYHFHREELYLTLSNGTIQRYKINVTGSHTLSIGSLSNQPPTTVYTTVGGNTLGNITVDWLYDIIYWIEFEDSTTKVNRMAIDSDEVICAVSWNSRSVNKIMADPVHGYMYWSVHGDGGLFRGELKDFRNSASSACPNEVETEADIFLTPTLTDFVLEPDVFIYLIDNRTLHFIGFDKQNNGSVGGSIRAMFVESFGDATVTIIDNFAVLCNVTSSSCPVSVAAYPDGEPPIDDILVFRKSKQPLPAPPSYPVNVHVFAGSSTASISWERPSFVQSFFGMSAYDDWWYCVNYTTVDVIDNDTIECTRELQITLSSLENDALYQFIINASGPGGEKVAPHIFVFRTKPAGSETAGVLVSTDVLTKSNLNGTENFPVSERPDVLEKAKESNGVAYDIRNDLYFWIIEGGQGPLYRYNTADQEFSTLRRGLDRPVSLAADWVARRLFWVQDGINVADDQQLVSISMDASIDDGVEDIFTRDPRITAIAVDSLNGRIFWIDGKDIMMGHLNGLVQMTCYSLDSEPLALALDVEKQYMYWLTFHEGNIAMLSQLNYTREQCGISPVTVPLPGSILASSSRGVLTYGLGTLYLTTVSSTNQSVYVFPADFASIDSKFTLAFGVIPQDDVVRDILIVSDVLQPLPDGLVMPGLSSVAANQLDCPPRLRENESSTSVIVIEWGRSPTNISQPILYEVDYILSPFGESAMDPVKKFTTDTFIRLEGQTFYTEVTVTVTPHTPWLRSNASLSVTCTFTSPPMEPGQVINVRSYVYHPTLENDDITALIVWDALSDTEAGGIVSHYNVTIRDVENNNIVFMSQTTGNESYFIVRQFVTKQLQGNNLYNVLEYPLLSNMMYQVQVFAINTGGSGPLSDVVNISTYSVRPPQQLLVVTSGGSQLCGTDAASSYEAVNPVTINTLSRLMYWYNSTEDSVMVQSLDGSEISVFIESPPISVTTMAYEWQGERLYMAGFNAKANRHEIWRAPVEYSKGIEHVYQMSEEVQSVSHLVIDSFRQGAAFWLQMVNEDTHLVYFSLSNTMLIDSRLTNLSVSALTLDPSTGDLWVSDRTDGGIFTCNRQSGSCEEVVDADSTGTSVISIGLDEHMVYWTNGSVIKCVNRTSSSPLDFECNCTFDENEVISLHSLSPGQQPQYLFCTQTATCLAPNLVIKPRSSLPDVTSMTTTNTSIEVRWTMPTLSECCTDVFSYPLVRYGYGVKPNFSEPEDPFGNRLKIDNLKPYVFYTITLAYLNIYTISFIDAELRPKDLSIEWFDFLTDAGVPDIVDSPNATPFGVTCINVTWSGTSNSKLNGPPENRTYFVTVSGDSSGSVTTYNAGDSTSLAIDVNPGEVYEVKVKVSNMVFNSSEVVKRNVQSWPQAPPPVLVNETLLNTSFAVMVTLDERHVDIISLFIEAISLNGDGTYQKSIEENVTDTFPMSLSFNISGVSPYTLYNVHAVATYRRTSCSQTMFHGEILSFTTESGVPDAPKVFIGNDAMITWSVDLVNSRSPYPIDSYLLEAREDGIEVGKIDIRDIPSFGNITQDLSDGALNLVVDRRYNICVTARNMIGFGMPGCDGSYVHMERDEAPTDLSVVVYAGAGGGAVAVILLLIAICSVCGYIVYKRRQKKALARLAYAYGPDLELSNVRAQRYYRTNASSNQRIMWSREDFVATEEELAQLNQFPRQYLTLQTFIGQGEFGEVFQGTAFDILGPETGSHPVAIKTFRKGASSEEKHKFLSEAALMGKFNHPNIVKILAVCVDNDPVFIIMELLPAGDLLKFLREARPELGPALLTREEQVHITLDVANGCRYLEQQHFIHRDLAARNCLVSSKGANRVVKIGDFGLARDLYSADYYRVEGERKLPVRWMAPEALLQGKFTIESDVWAYGVLLHEVMSFGNQPYPGQSNQDVLQFVTAGGRLPKPENCPQRIYRIMMQCWRKYASERPRFEEICNILNTILEDMRRESYCESDSDDEGDALSREGSKKFPSRTPSFKSGFQNLVRTGSKKLRNSLRRHSMLRKEEQTTHTSVSSCENLIPRDNGDTFRESGLI